MSTFLRVVGSRLRASTSYTGMYETKRRSRRNWEWFGPPRSRHPLWVGCPSLGSPPTPLLPARPGFLPTAGPHHSRPDYMNRSDGGPFSSRGSSSRLCSREDDETGSLSRGRRFQSGAGTGVNRGGGLDPGKDSKELGRYVSLVNHHRRTS